VNHALLPTEATTRSHQDGLATSIVVASLVNSVLVKVIVRVKVELLVLVLVAVLVDVTEVVVGCKGTNCSGLKVIATALRCADLLPETATVEFTSVSRKDAL